MNRSGRYCDGVNRRDMLRLGAAGLFGMSWTLPGLLAAEGAEKNDVPNRAEAAGSGKSKHNKSLIYIILEGGLSTIDTWDLKPNAPAEFRGDFRPIDTNVPGLQISEHLPRMARHMDKLSLVRSFNHRNSNHGEADHYMLTGYHPTAGFNPTLNPNNQRPSHGSIVARKMGSSGTVPPFVCLPQMPNSAGSAYLGPAASPFVIEADPSAPGFSVPDLAPPVMLGENRLASRRKLLERMDRFQKGVETEANAGAQTVNVFRQKAFSLMTSPEAKKAFDIHAEPEKLRDEYGRSSLGQGCLMARRLVESGVRCVMVDHTNWDTHDNNFRVLKNELLPKLDAALATLFRDLADRGMLESTMVVISGEFGRTPRINPNAGRDHWGPCFTLALGGGGIQGGRAVGKSDARAEKPAENAYGPEDMAATMHRLLGINPEHEFHTPEGRPVKIANDGRLIRELI